MVIRRSLRFSISEENLWARPSLSLSVECFVSITTTLKHHVATVILVHTVATITLDHTAEIMTLDTIVSFGTIIAFGISLVALLKSSPVMWRKENLRNFSVLRKSKPFQSCFDVASRRMKLSP
jgi:Zn-dependent protease